MMKGWSVETRRTIYGFVLINLCILCVLKLVLEIIIMTTHGPVNAKVKSVFVHMTLFQFLSVYYIII